MEDENYTLSIAEQLLKDKNNRRQDRTMKFGKERRNQYGNPAARQTEGLKVSKPVRTFEADDPDLEDVDLRRVKSLKEVKPDD